MTKTQNHSKILNNALNAQICWLCIMSPGTLHIFDSLWESSVKIYFEIKTDWLTLNLSLFPGLHPSVQHCAGAVCHTLVT